MRGLLIIGALFFLGLTSYVAAADICEAQPQQTQVQTGQSRSG
jgi:hypothetical protein